MIIVLDDSESEAEASQVPSNPKTPHRRKPVPKAIISTADSSSYPSTPALRKAKALMTPTTQIKVESESTFSSPANESINDIPEFARTEWLSSFLPTFYAYLGSCADPFSVCTGKGIVKEIQDIVDIVYPTANYKVQYNTKFYSVVNVNLILIVVVNSSDHCFHV